MSTATIAQIRMPTDEELNELRGLWSALRRQSLPSSTSVSDELQTYLRHATHMVGLIAGLNSAPGQTHWENARPLTVSVDGIERLRDSARPWMRVLSLWSPTDAVQDAQKSP